MFISYIHIIQERVVPGFAQHENTCFCEQVVWGGLSWTHPPKGEPVHGTYEMETFYTGVD